MDDGRIGHAELALAGGVLYLADEYPEIGLRAPVPGSTSVSLMLHVADTDVALARARDRGARVEREPYENYGSRNAGIIDPFGHRWMLSGPQTGAPRPFSTGTWATFGVDTRRRSRGDVLRPRARLGLRSGHPPGHQHRQHIGIFEVGDRRTLFCCYAVTDLDGARHASPRAAGSPVRCRSSSSEPCSMPPTRRAHRSRSSRRPGHAPSRAQRLWARRTFVHHLRGAGCGRFPVVLQRTAVLDVRAGPDRGRLAGAVHPSDGRGGRRQSGAR